MDVFGKELCSAMSYDNRGRCYDILNDHEDELREWFKASADSAQEVPTASFFKESFCFRRLSECDASVAEASEMDIEQENYEEDKDKIDPDFMPEFTEEAIKAEQSDYKAKLAGLYERALDARDDALDFWDKVDDRVKGLLEEKVVSHPLIKERIPLHVTEHVVQYWHAILAVTVFIVLFLPMVLLRSRILSNAEGEAAVAKAIVQKTETAAASTSAVRRRKQVHIKLPPNENVLEASSSDADQADVENDSSSDSVVSRSSGRSSRSSRSGVRKSTSSAADAPPSPRRSIRATSRNSSTD
jgi:hypothetical protein